MLQENQCVSERQSLIANHEKARFKSDKGHDIPTFKEKNTLMEYDPNRSEFKGYIAQNYDEGDARVTYS